MTIYTSEKVMPYVYMCIHNQTGRFYIGSRYTKSLNKPSHEDFPLYKTSSKQVRPNFHEYSWYIVAEFFNRIDAYQYEQQLIYENWLNPQLINAVCRHNTTKMFSPEKSTMSEARRTKLIEYNRSRTGTTHTPETKAKMSATRKGKQWNVMTEEIKRKISESNRGKTLTEDQKARHKAATADANRARCLGKKRDPSIASKAWETRRLRQHEQ